MKKIIPLIMVTALLASCEADLPAQLDCASGNCDFVFEVEKRLFRTQSRGDEFIEIREGNDMVFYASFVEEDDPFIADDEYSERILIQVPATDTDFLYEGDAIADLNIYVLPSCFCPPEIGEAWGGKIAGTKLADNTWKLEIELDYDLFEAPMKRIIEGEFKGVN